jgi:hypothetical protein
MKAKHTFKYTYEEGHEDFSPVEVTFDIPSGEVTVSQMLYNFECYLKACGFVFDGHLEVVDEEKYDGSELDWQPIPEITPKEDPSKYKTFPYQTGDFFEHQPTSICSSDKHNITAEDPKKFFPKHGNGLATTSSSLDNEWTKTEAEKKIKEWNEGIAKLDNEQRIKKYEENVKMSQLHYDAIKETEKNKWVHGMCNPPSPDWKRKKHDGDFMNTL